MAIRTGYRRVGEGGFTLIEMVAVIAIIAVLSTVLLGAGRWSTENGRTVRSRAELASLAAALESYRRAHGDYPRTASSDHLLQSLIGKRGPTGTPIESRAYLELAQFSISNKADPFADVTAKCVDPWGHPYRYAYRSSVPWTRAGFVLYSSGPDGDSAELLSGGWTDDSAAVNRDNIHAQP